MSENCAAAGSTSYRPPFPDSWISDAFARETEALTKALQVSLSSTDSLYFSPSSVLLNLIKPEPTAAVSNIPHSGLKRAATSTTGRISKRKSRRSKRCPTTYIDADPANFRQLVQLVTGVRDVDANLPVDFVSVPPPQGVGGSPSRLLPQSCLPTPDTSAYLVDRAWMVGPEPVALGSSGPEMDGGPAGFELEPFPSFPTLESWGFM